MINLIVACGQDRVIGKKGRLPWSIEEDWKYFMETTKGGSMIMGKVCYQEFEKHIEDREVIGLTRSTTFKYPHARTANSLQEGISIATRRPIWICGGEALYKEAFALADRLYITLINKPFEGDVFFPEWETIFTRVLSRKVERTSEFEMEFLIVEKPLCSNGYSQGLPR